MNLELAILNVLTACKTAIPSTAILGEVGNYTHKRESLHDVEAALLRLERKRHVRGTESQDDGIVWTETDDGRLRCA